MKLGRVWQHSLLSAILLVAAAEVFGQSPPQSPPPIPIPDTVELLKDIEYCKGGGKPLRMDILRPKAASQGARPAVLYLHAGGWQSGSKDDARTALFLATNGFVTAAINYRLSGEAPFPAAVEDSKCAVRFLRANAAKYGIGPNRIGVIGDSAGGHLAMMVGCADEKSGLEGSGGWPGVSSRVQAVVSNFGASDLAIEYRTTTSASRDLRTQFIGGTLQEKPDEYRRASPITYVSSDDPPLLLLHVVKEAEHGFRQAGEKPISPGPREIAWLTLSFFQKHL